MHSAIHREIVKKVLPIVLSANVEHSARLLWKIDEIGLHVHFP